MILKLIKMKIFRRITQIIICTTLIATQVSCNSNVKKVIKPQIIPIPTIQTIIKGSFVINNATGIQFSDEFKVAANFLKAFIEKGSKISIKNTKSSKNIVFIKDDDIDNTEGYSLDITPNSITIKAKTPKGAFYAVQSLRQLLPVSFENKTFKEKQIAVQCLKIMDSPKFKYRGMHLDVGRHFFSVNFIKKYIDALSMLKMNTFHWHLTEDQGWRIEIKKYPKLQEIAAYRKETLIGHYSNQPQKYDGKKYGGFYTQEDIKDIVAYATERQVTIIPEIELPGHSQAAIAAYPKLGCTGKQIETATKWGVFEDIYCSKEETFIFLENVLDEVLELFPSKYIHIGGDEAPKKRWKNCNECQKRIKSAGLKNEHELQNYFITRIEEYLNSKGRQIIGWDEILEGGLAPNATVMSWRGTQGAIDAAKDHHNVILTPGSHCYFDHYQSTNKDEPIAIGGFLPLKKVYNFNPIPKELTKDETKYVLGAQGNVWTEYMQNSKKVEYMVFPRILAMSEVVWSQNKNKNYDDFVARLEKFNLRLDALNINYANYLYEIEGKIVLQESKLSYKLKTYSKDKQIRFTLDGSTPTKNSKIYTNPIEINKKLIVKASVFNNDKQIGKIISQKFNFHKAVGKKISLNVQPNKSYNAGGTLALINGVSGNNKRYGDKEWLGFSGDDVEITIDLGKETDISSISIRFFNNKHSWIYPPKEIQATFIDNKKQYYNVEDTNNLTKKVTIKTKVKTRFIKLKIVNFGIIPKEKKGAGHKAWLFIDEIIVE